METWLAIYFSFHDSSDLLLTSKGTEVVLKFYDVIYFMSIFYLGISLGVCRLQSSKTALITLNLLYIWFEFETIGLFLPHSNGFHLLKPLPDSKAFLKSGYNSGGCFVNDTLTNSLLSYTYSVLHRPVHFESIRFFYTVPIFACYSIHYSFMVLQSKAPVQNGTSFLGYLWLAPQHFWWTYNSLPECKK